MLHSQLVKLQFGTLKFGWVSFTTGTTYSFELYVVQAEKMFGQFLKNMSRGQLRSHKEDSYI